MSHYRHCQEKSGVASLRSESRPRATCRRFLRGLRRRDRTRPAMPAADMCRAVQRGVGRRRIGIRTHACPGRRRRAGRRRRRRCRWRRHRTPPGTDTGAGSGIAAVGGVLEACRRRPARAYTQRPPGNPECAGGSRGIPSRRYRRRPHDRVSRRRTTQRLTAIDRDAPPGREAPRTGTPPRPAGEVGRPPQPWSENASCVAGAT